MLKEEHEVSGVHWPGIAPLGARRTLVAAKTAHYLSGWVFGFQMTRQIIARGAPVYSLLGNMITLDILPSPVQIITPAAAKNRHAPSHEREPNGFVYAIPVKVDTGCRQNFAEIEERIDFNSV